VGAPTASVLANQDPVLWVTEGVARSLVAQGFTVERVGTDDLHGDVPTITGKVTRASGGMYVTMDAHVTAELAIERGGTTVQTLMCSGTATRLVLTASADEYRSVFEAAMADFGATCGPLLARALTGGTGP